ncbi:MAG TPA: c(7)-type cytochrome triheme domain-containing protein [Anaeromyxobacteraceae bacterium]
MTRGLKGAVRVVLALGALLVATSALASGKLQRLPTDYVFPRGDGSPGPVMFSHESHVDSARPSCSACHPKEFRILEAGRTVTREPMRHDRMEAGAACGACHGKTAFGFDTCDMCHK